MSSVKDVSHFSDEELTYWVENTDSAGNVVAKEEAERAFAQEAEAVTQQYEAMLRREVELDGKRKASRATIDTAVNLIRQQRGDAAAEVMRRARAEAELDQLVQAMQANAATREPGAPPLDDVNRLCRVHEGLEQSKAERSKISAGMDALSNYLTQNASTQDEVVQLIGRVGDAPGSGLPSQPLAASAPSPLTSHLREVARLEAEHSGRHRTEAAAMAAAIEDSLAGVPPGAVRDRYQACLARLRGIGASPASDAGDSDQRALFSVMTDLISLGLEAEQSSSDSRAKTAEEVGRGAEALAGLRREAAEEGEAASAEALRVLAAVDEAVAGVRAGADAGPGKDALLQRFKTLREGVAVAPAEGPAIPPRLMTDFIGLSMEADGLVRASRCEKQAVQRLFELTALRINTETALAALPTPADHPCAAVYRDVVRRIRALEAEHPGGLPQAKATLLASFTAEVYSAGRVGRATKSRGKADDLPEGVEREIGNSRSSEPTPVGVREGPGEPDVVRALRALEEAAYFLPSRGAPEGAEEAARNFPLDTQGGCASSGGSCTAADRSESGQTRQAGPLGNREVDSPAASRRAVEAARLESDQARLVGGNTGTPGPSDPPSSAEPPSAGSRDPSPAGSRGVETARLESDPTQQHVAEGTSSPSGSSDLPDHRAGSASAAAYRRFDGRTAIKPAGPSDQTGQSAPRGDSVEITAVQDSPGALALEVFLRLTGLRRAVSGHGPAVHLLPPADAEACGWGLGELELATEECKVRASAPSVLRAASVHFRQHAEFAYPSSTPVLHAIVETAVDAVRPVFALTCALLEERVSRQRPASFFSSIVNPYAPACQSDVVPLLRDIHASLTHLESQYFAGGDWVATALPMLPDVLLFAALSSLRQLGLDAAALGCPKAARAFACLSSSFAAPDATPSPRDPMIRQEVQQWLGGAMQLPNRLRHAGV
ncbi:hypothetical protein DIPPA_30298 [Diplonema papillatum]|nr:hypothetical protein DIPPA_30298 [Diplonema papillatum]